MKTEGILVTGATGFVGRHLVPFLAKGERRLVLAVRNAASCPQAWRGFSNVAIVETGPLDTASALYDVLAEVSTVVHLAGMAHVGRSNSEAVGRAFQAANTLTTQRLADAAAARRVRTFIYMSSILAIADNVSQTVVSDDTDPAPSTAYGRSKLDAEQHVKDLSDTGAVGISLRPPLIIGGDAGGNWGALQRLAATGIPLPFASVRNRRSFVSVDTVAKAITHLCNQAWGPQHSGAYCLADDGTVSLSRLVTELRIGMGMSPRLFACRPRLLGRIGTLCGQQRSVSALLGDLEVDARRFNETFGFRPPAARESVRDSGVLYSRLQAREIRPVP